MATLQGVFRLGSPGRIKLVLFASAPKGNKLASRVAKPGQPRRPAAHGGGVPSEGAPESGSDYRS